VAATTSTVSQVGRDQRFAFAFDSRLALASLPFGVTAHTAAVEVDDLHLRIRFGPWRLITTRGNVEAATVSGPYAWWKVAGPPRLSLADGGITFATSARQGLCIRFRQPVPALLPGRLLRHPAATVTVAEPEALARALGVSP